MNRRDFLKLTAAFSFSAAVPAEETRLAIPPPASRLPDEPPKSARDAVLDIIASSYAYLAICEFGTDDIIGITPIVGVRPASGWMLRLDHLAVEPRRPCVLGRAKILDADEREILSFQPDWVPTRQIEPGMTASIYGIMLS